MSQPFINKKSEWEEFREAVSNQKAKQEADPIGSKAGRSVKESVIKFNLKPEELESYLNKYIVGQEKAIEIIATKVCTHFNRMEIEKSKSLTNY